MRAYELARVLGISAQEVLARLRGDGEWVASHLSVIPDPVARRYLPAAWQPDSEYMAVLRSPHRGTAGFTPPRPTEPLPVWKFRRKPGPRPVTMRQRARDEYDDPIRDLRYEPEISTRDVADLLGVRPGTVRRWVERGYLTPSGKCGASNLFDTREVLAAYDEIASRRRATGELKQGALGRPSLRPVDRISPKHYEAVVGVDEAARLLAVSPATIRSWIHRGHIRPLPSSRPRAVRLLLGDVISAGAERRLPRRSSPPRHRSL